MNEIAAVRKDRDRLLRETGPRFSSFAILFACLLVNLVFFLYRADYVALFVAASFYLNMFYFVSLLLPTSPAVRVGYLRRDIHRLFQRMREINLVPGTYRSTRLFINAFFINSRALAAGIGLIFTIDILYSVAAFFTQGLSFTTFLIVALQAFVILTFYFLVWKIEPFSTRFVRKVERIRNRLSRERIPTWIVAGLFLFLFLISVLILLITIILLPGVTITFFLTQSGLSEAGYLAFSLTCLGSGQYFFIRYIHGISSHTLAIRLYDNKRESLENLLSACERNRAENGGSPFDPVEATTTLLESRVYQIRRNTIFALFPVYVINLYFSVVLECTTFSAIRGYIRESGP